LYSISKFEAKSIDVEEGKALTQVPPLMLSVKDCVLGVLAAQEVIQAALKVTSFPLTFWCFLGYIILYCLLS
jgi:hypothetical protein